MNKTQKKEWIQNFNSMVNNSGCILLTRINGLNADDISQIRTLSREKGVSMLVVKNRLAKIALEGTEFNGMREFLVNQNAVFVSQSELGALSMYKKLTEKNLSEKIKIECCALRNEILHAGDVKDIAAISSIDELRAKIVSLIQSVPASIAGIISQPAQMLARVISMKK